LAKKKSGEPKKGEDMTRGKTFVHPAKPRIAEALRRLDDRGKWGELDHFTRELKKSRPNWQEERSIK